MAEGVSAHFTDGGARAVAAATEAARAHNAAEVGMAHLAVGVLQNADDDMLIMLSRYGLTADAARRRLIAARPDDPVVAAPPFGLKVRAALRLAHTVTSARESRIACAHLLMALLMMRDTSLLAFLRERSEIDDIVAWLAARVGEMS